MTSMAIKCSEQNDKTNNQILSTTGSMSDNNFRPITEGEAYWQDDYNYFVSAINIKIVNQGFYGAEVKYSYNCS